MNYPVLGFGCTKLTHNKSEQLALSNLETAFDSGISYFDTARMYGFGQSESILGKFIKNKRDQVLICSKVGLLPRELPSFLNLRMVNIIRNGLNNLSTVKNMFVKATNGLTTEMVFSPEEAEKSINQTLKELKTDYLDYLLLHEYNYQTANKEEVIDFLERMRAKGKVRFLGIGSQFSKLPNDLSKIDPSYQVIQIESSILNPVIKNYSKRKNQTIGIHSIFKNLMPTYSSIINSPKLYKELNQEIGVDLTNKNNLAALFLAAAKKMNPSGIVLFTSKNNKSIINNTKNWRQDQFSEYQISSFQNIINQKTEHSFK